MGTYARVECAGPETYTQATVDLKYGDTVTVRPNTACPEDAVVTYHDANSGVRWFIDLTAAQLDEFIAELQRLRSGCFHGVWPKPVTTVTYYEMPWSEPPYVWPNEPACGPCDCDTCKPPTVTIDGTTYVLVPVGA